MVKKTLLCKIINIVLIDFRHIKIPLNSLTYAKLSANIWI